MGYQWNSTKPGKDPELCARNHYLMLMQSGYKNTGEIGLIHPFPDLYAGQGPNINLHRIYPNISQVTNTGSQGVVASLLDAEKASMMEWEFLWQTLERFRFGNKFIRTIDIILPTFYIRRGTRQACPPSPGLFALAIEPLAILIRSSATIGGLSLGPEKLSLYMDDALLYFPDASDSLVAALEAEDHFGSFSSIRINWPNRSSFHYP